jgi:hypothetical protein
MSPTAEPPAGLDRFSTRDARRFTRDIAIAVGIVFVTLTLAVALALAFNAGIAAPSGAVVRPVTPRADVHQNGQGLTPSVPAQARSSVAVFASPSSRHPSDVLRSPTASGDPLTVLVSGPTLGSTWLRVYLPQHPSDNLGWIHASAVTLSADGYFVDINLAPHVSTMSNEGLAVLSTSIDEGHSALPTPRGRFFIVDLLKST